MASPTEVIRHGTVQVSLFRNEGEKGPFYAAATQRRYRKEQSGEWETSHSYTVSQLAVHIACCQKALSRMLELEGGGAD